MKLSTPGEVETEESATDESAETGDRPAVRTVSVGGEEMTEVEAIELFGEMLYQPESFGFATQSEVEELRDRVGELEEENEQLREDLDVANEFLDRLRVVLDKAESLKQVRFGEVEES